MPRPSVGDEVTADLIDYLTYKPICQLEGQSATSIAHNTDTAVPFSAGSEVFDDEAWHDTSTNNTRITPNIAGRYRVWGWSVWTGSTTITACNTAIFKNAAVISRSGNHKPNATNGVSTYGSFIQTTVDMNGSTDYLELFVNHLSAGSVAETLNNAASGRSTLGVQLISRT